MISLISQLYCVVFYVALIIMLCVSALRSCGVLLYILNTFAGQCVVLSTSIVILTYHVLYRSVDVICSECLIHISQSLICIIPDNTKKRCLSLILR